MVDNSLIGRRLANFELQRLLGRGGMAEVYYGLDVKLQRPVAVKVIDVRYRGHPAYAARFVREAQTVATWRHEHIIQIYYADDEDSLYYFVMEYLDGSDLHGLMASYVAKNELMPPNEVLRLGRAVANALDYAHRRGVIHRDVKPSNIMVASDGRVVLTDFGLALDVEQGSLGEVFGSAHYMAPEQARRSADAVPQSDLYALGVVLYELLTGQVPFDDPSPTSVAVQHLTAPPPSPRELNPNLSPVVEEVLLKVLSKSPAERYQTGAELMNALTAAFQASQPDDVTLTSPLLTPSPSFKTRANLTTGDLIGQQLDEYRLEKLLGQGRMARVYRGRDVRLQRWLAIKVIDNPCRINPDYRMRFEREAQAIAQLEHPHIVQLYRCGEANGLLYLAMQYIDGADLDSVLTSYCKDGGFIEPEKAGRIIREICLALDYAHNKGVIHRDVKPSNIILDEEGRAILADFGLAVLDEVGTQGKVFGSPRYIAPEQVMSSANVVPQSDLYAVGVTLYQMFTGQLPFDHPEPMEVAMLHLVEAPLPPRKLRPEISPELEAVMLKALAKKPEERYPTGLALADALDQALRAVTTSGSVPALTKSGLSISQRVEAELIKQPLPPLPLVEPATLSQPSQPQLAPVLAAPSTSQPARSSAGKTTWLFVAGLGVLGMGLALLMLVAGAVYWFWPHGEGTQPAEVIPTPTSGPTETAAAVAQPPAPPEENPIGYELLVTKRKDESLFVINRSTAPFPLARLSLGNDKEGINGAEWGVELLDSGACVAVWKDGGHPKPPEEVACREIGQRLTRDKGSRFWQSAFNISYSGNLIGTCQKEQKQCYVSILLE
jgi:serine/threonine protein kinase